MARITFVCGAPFGGALHSTLSLAECGASDGHRVTMVAPEVDPYLTRRRLDAALVRVEDRSARLGRGAWWMHDRMLGRSRVENRGGVEFRWGRDLVAATRACHEPGAVMVVNSVRRLDLRRLVELARATNSRVCWYLREDSALRHAEEFGPAVDVLIANSRPLARVAESATGRTCHFIPSVVSVDGLEPPLRRESILLVNTEPDRGIDVAIELGRRLVAHRVVLQESWPTPEPGVEAILERIAGLPNVEFRRRAPRGEIYRDARVMISPHSAASIGNQRPRVALEAQFLGIPMIAYDIPGLAAVSASAELLVPVDAPIDEWVRAVQRVEADFSHFSDAAAAFARRELRPPSELWDCFARLVGLDDHRAVSP